MDIGITATRNGLTERQKVSLGILLVSHYVGAKNKRFRHGSCRGGDAQAARLVRKLFGKDVEIYCHPGPKDDPNQEDSGVDNVVHDPTTHFARNRNIVDGVSLMFACPYEDKEQAKGGTWYTVSYSRKAGVPVVIIWPDGSIG